MTAKIVIASAARLIDVRHFCRNRKRIAEISVPAWPIPIQKTKFVMSKAQPTGTLRPQMPMPSQKSQAMREAEARACEAEQANAIHHPRLGVRSDGRRDGFGDRMEVMPAEDQRGAPDDRFERDVVLGVHRPRGPASSRPSTALFEGLVGG